MARKEKIPLGPQSSCRKKRLFADAERFEDAWNKLEKAYTSSAINVNGMRSSDAAFFESIYRLQTSLNNKTGMALGQNFQIFDEKVINNQLQQIIYNYTQMGFCP